MADFETTVYEGQENTEVWAAACVELKTEDVKIFHSIGEQFDYFVSLNCNVCAYYHNLKFDGAFWLSFLLVDLQYEQAFEKLSEADMDLEKQRDKDMKNRTFKYAISDMGQWYTITIKVNDHIIEIRDSLKLLPFSVKRIGESFKTKHRKLDMEYTGFRYAGCPISDSEKEYIANDVLVVKEALEIMFEQGHSKLTIGSCCLEEFKHTIPPKMYKMMFPDLSKMEIDSEQYKYKTVDEYIRKSYRGGWCYLVKGKENALKYNGTTADVNSLYPSMMSRESGNKYPIGEPTFWKGNYIPDGVENNPQMYFFVRIKTRFYLKDGMLPFIQLKGNSFYVGTESLTTSDIWDERTGKYYWLRTDKEGHVFDTRVEMTLTESDYHLIQKHYDLVECEILDGCVFRAKVGIFDEYIEKYRQLKMTSKGALRELAKLFLNNLYGKMASSTNSDFKYAYVKQDKSVGFMPVLQNNKRAGYIACGSAITSYSRCFTITAAQQNYYGVNKRGFIYADTDSIHCDLMPNEIRGIKIDNAKFCCWKLESAWDVATFARQKTYIEHITHENIQLDEPMESFKCEPEYNVKCAGMPERAKSFFVDSLQGTYLRAEEEWTEEEKQKYNKMDKATQEWVKTKRELTDFYIGLSIPSGKLLPKRIRGGILLKETGYEMR